MRDRGKNSTEASRRAKSKANLESATDDSVWATWLESDRRQQNQLAENERLRENQLGAIRGLLGRAMRITVRWLLDHPSAPKKRAYALELQERIAELGNIVAKLEYSGKDAERWLATVARMRSLSRKVGIPKLAAIADQLPSDLPATAIHVVGRPRKDGQRLRIEKLRSQNKSWKEIAGIMNMETGEHRTSDAYRSLWKSRRK